MIADYISRKVDIGFGRDKFQNGGLPWLSAEKKVFSYTEIKIKSHHFFLGNH